MKYSILLSLALYGYSTWSIAQEKTSLHVCGVSWPPFTVVENGKITSGLSFDIYSEAFKRLNISFEADEVPWARCVLYVESGTFDAIMDNNVKSPKFINGTHPTSAYPIAIFVEEKFNASELAWEDLRGKKLGMVRGYEYPEAIKKNTAGFIPDEAIDDAMMMRKLKIGRYNYVVSDLFSSMPISKQEGVSVKMLKPLLSADYLYLSFNKNRTELMHKYDEVLGQMIKDGTIDVLYKKYLPYSYNEVIELHSPQDN